MISSYYTDRNRHEMTHLHPRDSASIQHLVHPVRIATYENRSHLSFSLQTCSGVSSPVFVGGFSGVLWEFFGGWGGELGG